MLSRQRHLYLWQDLILKVLYSYLIVRAKEVFILRVVCPLVLEDHIVVTRLTHFSLTLSRESESKQKLPELFLEQVKVYFWYFVNKTKCNRKNIRAGAGAGAGVTYSLTWTVWQVLLSAAQICPLSGSRIQVNARNY